MTSPPKNADAIITTTGAKHAEPEVLISAIHIGHRHRQTIGDVSALAASIQRLGMLQPIGIDGKNHLVFGVRRLAAVKTLGWTKIPVRVIRSLSDAPAALIAERDENIERRDLLPSEIVSIARALEPLERAEAKARQGTRTDKHGGKFPPCSRGKRRDTLAAAVGVSGRTLDKATAVVLAAEQNAKYGPLVASMDRTGNIHGAFRDLQRYRDAERIAAEPAPLPSGRYRVIVVDPPWRYDLRRHDVTHHLGKCPYADLSVAEICALPVSDLAADDCVLWLWTTNAHMRESFAVLDAWGFESKTILTWTKPRAGVGIWLRGQTEHCHLAVRGKPTVLLTNESTLLTAPRGAHSEKPDGFYRLVEQLCPGSKLELFARRSRRGWIAHGNAIAPAAGGQDVH